MFGFKAVKTGIVVCADSILIRGSRAGLGKGNITASICRVVLAGFLLTLLGSSLAIARVSSPGNVTFTNPNALNTGAIFDSSGTFVLQLTASDGVKATTATVTITVNSPVIMPKLIVGSSSAIAGNSVDIPISLSSGTTGIAGLQFDLDLPTGISTGPVIAGPASLAAGKGVSSNVVGNDLRVLISGLNQNTMGSGVVAIVTLQAGASLPTGSLSLPLLNVTASDINGISIPMSASILGTLAVTANKAPLVSVGPNQTVVFPSSATLTATASDDGAPNPPGALTYSWSVL